MRRKKFDFDDILIQPAETSDINSRSQVNIYENYLGTPSLPIITAPMDTVYDGLTSIYEFRRNSIIYTIPRNNMRLMEKLNDYENRHPSTYSFVSISLDDFEDLANHVDYFINPKLNYCILVDIANGHMKKLLDNVKKFKDKLSNNHVKLMVGNIANPRTYRNLSDAGADLIRVSVGTGSACLTSQQTSIGYPMASLIEECYKESMGTENSAKIVADGGFSKYSDIIKALGLGADYVMTGSIINKAIETGGTYYFKNIKVSKKFATYLFDKGFEIKKLYRGMSTKDVQKKWGKQKLTTSEGVVKKNKVEYYLYDWMENFKDYLRSAMSYTGSKNLDEFKTSKYNLITTNAHNRFKK